MFSLLDEKEMMFYQIRIERSHPLRCTPSLLYLESDCDEI